MSQLDSWLRRQAIREGRILTLDRALLSDRMWAYAAYRLRYFFANYLTESAGHAVMVLLAFRHLRWNAFLLIVAAHALTTLMSSSWWGGLEAMRERVRDLHRSGRSHRIDHEIGGWLTLAAWLSAACVVIAVLWIVFSASTGHLGAAQAYAATLMLRVACDLPVRCYHSGVYALRRVYRPLAATIAPDLLGLATLLALFPWIGMWALVVSSLILTAVLTSVSFIYTHRVYQFLGFKPFERLGSSALRASVRGAGRETLAAGGSYAVMALDSLIVLLLLHGAQADSKTLVVLFAVVPTIRASADWSRLLYFDFKRLQLRLFGNLRRRFERHVTKLAWVLGAVFAVLGCGFATSVYGRSPGVLYPVNSRPSLGLGVYLAMPPFFIARSLLARHQIQRFAERAYGVAFATGLLCVAGLLAVDELTRSEEGRLVGVAVVTAITAAVLAGVVAAADARGNPGAALLSLEWLRRLGEIREPVLVGSACVASAGGPERLDAQTRRDRDQWRLDQLADRAARRLGRAGAASWFGPNRVVWFEASIAPGRSARITPRWLGQASGGLVTEVVSRECPDGEAAVFAAANEQLLGQPSSHLLTAVVPIDVEGARRRFEKLIPGGVVYDPTQPVAAAIRELSANELRAILADALAFARELSIRRPRSSFDVTALCAAGELRLIFIADRHHFRRRRARWREYVADLNARGAIGGAKTIRAA